MNDTNWTTLVLVLLSVLFWVSQYFLGFFQTIIHTIIIIAMTLLILKVKGDI